MKRLLEIVSRPYWFCVWLYHELRIVGSLDGKRKKCAQAGHRARTQQRSGYRLPKGPYEYRYVAVAFIESREVCKRCREVLQDWQEIEQTGLDSLTLDTPRMRQLKRDGVLWD